MSPSALNPTTEVIKVVCSMSLEEMPADVKALEERIVEKVQQSGREFYAAVFWRFSAALVARAARRLHSGRFCAKSFKRWVTIRSSSLSAWRDLSWRSVW